MKDALLDVRDLCVSFRQRRGETVRAVDGLSYTLPPGGTLAIIGESGCGKTASCRALLGLLPASATLSGSAFLSGQPLLDIPERERRRIRGSGIAMVFQDAARALNPTMRVGQQIVEALRQHKALDRHEARERAIDLLDRLRVATPRQRFLSYPHELSGGVRQRVMIAIALAGEPRMLIADEATRSLDTITQAETLALLKNLQQQTGMALLFVSHDLRLAAKVADEVLVMYAGRAVERATGSRLFTNARMPYTRALLEAIPDIDRAPHTPFPMVPGEPPDLTSRRPGCAFAARCTCAQSICHRSTPVLAEPESGHAWACWYPWQPKEEVAA